ncbi:hypothetical protein IEI94_15575 [Halomonas sp. ML-15]|uniref:hypothetical protein n=1 Tax=Halomonas sp. ML-15 TaxID=2773305 RepID=UPI001746AB97|nr:hypothetical protein [Halomonas sp. ML-15]MBD3897274.1 hypothetical protein [Halomonas sp. ML-15]
MTEHRDASAHDKPMLVPLCGVALGVAIFLTSWLAAAGQHTQTHFYADILKGFGQKICRPHPSLKPSEWVLDCLAPETHHFRRYG